MRNFRALILTVPLLLPLGGCAGMAESALNLPSGVLTQTIQNPVTKDTLYRVENALIVVAVGLKTYKNWCNSQPVGDQCDTVVAKLQSYSKRARPLLRGMRTFVRKNDQVNAKIAFQSLKGIFAEFRATATAAGIPIPAALNEVQ